MDQGMWAWFQIKFEAQEHISNLPKPWVARLGHNLLKMECLKTCFVCVLERHWILGLLLFCLDLFSSPINTHNISEQDHELLPQEQAPRITKNSQELGQAWNPICSLSQAIPSIPLHSWRSQESFPVFQQALDIPEHALSRTLIG